MTLAYWRREAIENEVVNLLQDYGVSVYPLDIKKLILQMGIEIINYEDASEQDRALFRAASTDAFSIVDSYYMNPKIIINQSINPKTRQLFSLGHELGHIWLGHSQGNPLSEAEADYFSGYLFAPHPLIMQNKLFSADSIASTFKTGNWCANIAFNQAVERVRKGSNLLLPHEQWIIDNIILRGIE